MPMGDVYIAGGLRTYIGAANKAYKNIPAEALAAAILRQLDLDAAKRGISIDTVIAGNATGGGGNIARLSLLTAGMKDSIAGITLDAQCASGLESIITGYARIRSGLSQCTIAGGTESASTRCIRSWNPNHPNYDSSRNSNAYQSAQFIPEDFSENSMIHGADETCRKHGIRAEDMIPPAMESHKNAEAARQNGDLKKILLPCFGAHADQLIRPAITKNFISRLRPVLQGGIITPATSCLFSDGAAFVTLTDERLPFFTSGEENSSPRKNSFYKIAEACSVGADRFLSPESLIVAIKTLLKKSGLRAQDIDRIDYNQAFACVDILYKKEFSNPSNAFGGALAYGHPYGASGAMILLHLICAMEKSNESLGIAAIPAAGGTASAILIQREQD